MLDYAALAAFAAVLRTGSFDAAAQILGVTQSAVSQRVKALEERLGCNLVQRTRPARPTEAGQRMLRHIEDVTLMEAQLIKDLGLLAPNMSAHFRIAAEARRLMACPCGLWDARKCKILRSCSAILTMCWIYYGAAR